ncbi:uncharacterized protein LOC124944424 [Impatiens glandulifera]|uniref:uncharacterized protein LOC124944424 n=1 Tax=Impatiens glandulifera TaxID=253017 RepID=UPI001FB087C9|nr:uncharacterized protein LOC124944424 [Impatiens glandulifera]
MSAMSGRQVSTVSDLVEEGKKRIVLLIVCVVGLSYLMSLTSSSVWVNMPIAASLVVLIRYLALDYDMRRKAARYKSSKPASANISSQKKPVENPKPIVSDWKKKVNSPVVEDAIDHFTQHIVSEWVTDLWYSRITPDKQGPEELVRIINGVLGEISCRARNINLIDLLTRDIINLFCTHLELFRSTAEKIERKQHPESFTFEQRDMHLKAMLAADNKLHPALISPEAEHKVLQRLMEGLISLTFKPKDLQCSLLRYIVRELLSCVVIRPVVNLANPRFINERIESLVISMKKNDKGTTAAQVASQIKSMGPPKTPSDNLSRVMDPSFKGVELVQLKKAEPARGQVNGTVDSKDPLLSMDPRSTRSWSSLPSDNQGSDKNDVQRHNSGGEWVEVLDMMSRKKTEALAPEHFDNMWTRGRNYRKEVSTSQVSETSAKSAAAISKAADSAKAVAGQSQMYGEAKTKTFSGNTSQNFISGNPSVLSHEDDEDNFNDSDETESASSSSCPTEDDETSNVTGLDSPVTKVWDGKSNRNLSVSRIHHPLESFKKSRKTRKGRSQKTQLGRKRSRLSSKNVHMWQEVERTSFLSGDGKDILQPSRAIAESEEDSGDENETEQLGRISTASSISVPGTHHLVPSTPKNSFFNLSFMKLRCEVQGANIVKSGSRNFAVYSISVTDVNNHSWSIKRRFSHFEELHRRLKEFPEYNLHLPPKHFLSTGLDVPIIQERCKLLDQYLKKLLQFPVISESIEVWDFLSVDSQTYLFSNSISIIETFSVDDHASSPHERNKHNQNNSGPQLLPQRGLNSESHAHPSQMKPNNMKDVHSPQKNVVKETRKLLDDSGSDSGVEQNTTSRTGYSKMAIKEKEGNDPITSSEKQMDAASDPTLPTEWVPPNLSIPILDLVDVIFQLQDGGWIRRQAFWVAKQVLQLGMGDAFDDWLIEKIKRLRRGSVVAAGIRRIEQILWPDGIFITKHPNRRKPPPADDSSPSSSSNGLPPSSPISQSKKVDAQKLEEEQQAMQAEERAKFVYELMIDKAPAAVVGLVGRKEYEQSAKDVYYFIQSSVCMKQFALDLVELLLLSAFPEMDYVFKELHEQRATFGKYKPD